MDLSNLKTSITQMNPSEAEALIHKRRKERRIVKKVFKAKKKTTTRIARKRAPKKNPLDISTMSAQQKQALLKLLGG